MIYCTTQNSGLHFAKVLVATSRLNYSSATSSNSYQVSQVATGCKSALQSYVSSVSSVLTVANCWHRFWSWMRPQQMLMLRQMRSFRKQWGRSSKTAPLLLLPTGIAWQQQPCLFWVFQLLAICWWFLIACHLLVVAESLAVYCCFPFLSDRALPLHFSTASMNQKSSGSCSSSVVPLLVCTLPNAFWCNLYDQHSPCQALVDQVSAPLFPHPNPLFTTPSP